MNNSVFGKTMENIRKRQDIEFVSSEYEARKYTRKSNFDGYKIFSPNFVAIHMKEKEITMNKPVYLGMCILDISKILMYNFHYNYIKPKYGEKAKLLFTDTDSLMYLIQTEDGYKDISPDIREMFDTSDFPEDHPSGIPTGLNKRVLGMFKDETKGKQINTFVGLPAKLYAYKMDEGKEEKKCKGIKKIVKKNNVSFEDYLDCLFNSSLQRRNMNVIRWHDHNLYSETVNKVALSHEDDKRVIQKDGIHTYAHGHFNTKSGGNSVSIGTTWSSSRTKPLLGAPSER